MKLIGYEKADFTANDGKKIKGCNVWLARAIDPARGKGSAVEKYYMTNEKIAAADMDLAALLNKDAEVYYNRYGKVERIVAR